MLDQTFCDHVWEHSPISYLVGGVEDFRCERCGAHGQRRRGEAITYCHGGTVNKLAIEALDKLNKEKT